VYGGVGLPEVRCSRIGRRPGYRDAGAHPSGEPAGAPSGAASNSGTDENDE
jgi:hypothetical protein